MIKAERQYLNSEELAEIFGVPEQTIRDWAGAGKITAVKVGGRWFFPKDRYIRNPDTVLKCVACDNLVKSGADFEDNLSRKEFGISGLCQSCQNKTFNKME